MEMYRNVVNGNIERFETAYKYLITPKTSVVKKLAIILSKEGFHLVRQKLYFCYKYLTT